MHREDEPHAQPKAAAQRGRTEERLTGAQGKWWVFLHSPLTSKTRLTENLSPDFSFKNCSRGCGS